MEYTDRSAKEFFQAVNYRKLQYIFSNGSLFRLSCAMSAFTVFVFLKAMVSMFGSVKLDELQSVYHMAGYDNMTTGIVDLCFIGAAAIILCLITAYLFSALSEFRKGRLDKAEKNMKAVRISLSAALCFTVILGVFSLLSVRTLDYYYELASKFYGGLTNHSRELFIRTMFFGIMAVVAEILMIKLSSKIVHLMDGDFERNNISFFETGMLIVLSFEIVNAAWENLYDILHFDYKTAGEYPAGLAMMLVSFMIFLAAIFVVIFLIEAVVRYLLYDEPEFEMFFGEGFESRVFSDEPLTYGQNEGYKLHFEIPHTEYPDFEESDGEKYG